MIDNPHKYACSECAGDNEITRGVFAEGKERKTCGYCRKRRLCIGLESLADAVDDNYRYNYEPCDGDGSRPSEIISELLELDQSAGELDAHLVSILHDRELHGGDKGVDPIYDEEMAYCSFSEKYPSINDGREHKELWDMYCEQIKHRTRYFNSKVIKWLNDIFLDLNKIIYRQFVLWGQPILTHFFIVPDMLPAPKKELKFVVIPLKNLIHHRLLLRVVEE